MATAKVKKVKRVKKKIKKKRAPAAEESPEAPAASQNGHASNGAAPQKKRRRATAESMADGIARLLTDTAERSEMLAGYEEVRQLLGVRNAAENAADILLEGAGGL